MENLEARICFCQDKELNSKQISALKSKLFPINESLFKNSNKNVNIFKIENLF